MAIKISGVTVIGDDQKFTGAGVGDSDDLRGAAYDSDVVITMKGVTNALNYTALDSNGSAQIAWDATLFINASFTLEKNLTVNNPTNEENHIGKTGLLKVSQDAGAGNTLSWGSHYLFGGGTAPTITDSASATDILTYTILGADQILINAAVQDIS